MSKGKTAHPLRILLADDHLIVRMGLATIISLEPDMEVVGEAEDGAEAARLADTLDPDVIIMDIMMPNVNGAEASRRILAKHPDAKILVLTTFCKSAEVRDAVKAGVVGALLKDASKSVFVDAIRRTAAGQRIVSPEIEREISLSKETPTLSPRQLAILTYVAKGFGNKEIARFEGISTDGVRAHLKSIFARLGVASRTEAATTAMDLKLINA